MLALFVGYWAYHLARWYTASPSFKGKTILVTGGAGFIGSNFVHHIRHHYPEYRILVLDLLTYAGSLDNLPPFRMQDGSSAGLEFWHGDVRNASLVDALVERADIVVHFAAETHVTRSIYDNYHFFETDVLGTQVVANSVLKHVKGIDRFIHISTSEVYGTARSPQMDEEQPLMPMSPYASAKAGGEGGANSPITCSWPRSEARSTT